MFEKRTMVCRIPGNSFTLVLFSFVAVAPYYNWISLLNVLNWWHSCTFCRYYSYKWWILKTNIDVFFAAMNRIHASMLFQYFKKYIDVFFTSIFCNIIDTNVVKKKNRDLTTSKCLMSNSCICAWRNIKIGLIFHPASSVLRPKYQGP